MSAAARLDDAARDTAWACLERLLSGVHPERGDPFRPEVAVVVHEEIAAHDPATLGRLARALAAAGGQRLVALGFDASDDGLRRGEAFALDPDMDAAAWVARGREQGWGLNGLSFVFADDTGRWALLTIVDVQAIACDADLLFAFYADLAAARAAARRFREAFDTPRILPAFRAMARRSRV